MTRRRASTCISPDRHPLSGAEEAAFFGAAANEAERVTTRSRDDDRLSSHARVGRFLTVRHPPTRRPLSSPAAPSRSRRFAPSPPVANRDGLRVALRPDHTRTPAPRARRPNGKRRESASPHAHLRHLPRDAPSPVYPVPVPVPVLVSHVDVARGRRGRRGRSATTSLAEPVEPARTIVVVRSVRKLLSAFHVDVIPVVVASLSRANVGAE